VVCNYHHGKQILCSCMNPGGSGNCVYCLSDSKYQTDLISIEIMKPSSKPHPVLTLKHHNGPIWSATTLLFLCKLTPLWYRGHVIPSFSHLLTMSHLDFLSHTDRFFQSWVASNNSTSKFCSLPMLQNCRTCERGRLIPLVVKNTSRLRTVPKHR